jgi:hypothetical protein
MKFDIMMRAHLQSTILILAMLTDNKAYTT